MLLALRGDETFGSSPQPIRDRFTDQLDIRKPSRGLIDFVAGQSRDQRDLLNLTKPDQADSLREFLYGKDIVDLLALVPDDPAKAADVISRLRPLAPRSYSIASSPNEHHNEVHLCVATVRYTCGEREHAGVASTYLQDLVNQGDSVRLYFVPNGSFRLPVVGDCPVIMIGPGTGVAPFRAFLQEHEQRRSSGRTWLFFGERNKATDFLYQNEINGFLERGVLTRLDLAFSRDQPDKIYVQDRLRERGAEIFEWLRHGAHVYVCGDAERMAKDVDVALHDIVARHGRMNADDAVAFVAELKRVKRYQRDVY